MTPQEPPTDPSFDQLRQLAERMLEEHPETAPELPARVAELVYELQVHQVELECQNQELRRAHEEIAALQRVDRDLYELAPCGYVTLDPQGIIQRANRTATCLLRCEREHLVQSPFSRWVAGEWQDAFGAARHQAADQGQTQEVELPLRLGNPGHATDPATAPNEEAWRHVSIAPECFNDGRVREYRVVLLDIDARKRAEQDNARLEHQMAQAQRLESIGRLAGGVAHDLNNRLMPILIHAECLLEEAEAEDPRRESYQAIITESERARDLVRHLLAFSRQQALVFSPLDVNQVVQNLHALLKRTLREDIQLELHLADNLPPVDGDAGQLENVLLNLTVNAQDAMPNGGTLSLSTDSTRLPLDTDSTPERLPPGRYIRLTVQDTGVGIADEVKPWLFEPFYTTKPAGEGTGLGLSSSHGIIEQHGGGFTVTSASDQGTAFTVWLPARAGAEPAVPTPPAEPALTSGSEPSRPSATLLLVEDEAGLRDLMHQVLERAGYTVIAAENGSRALNHLPYHRGPLDLLLTDVVMPDMSGPRLAEQVLERYPSLPIIFLSGYPADAFPPGSNYPERSLFLSKPISIRRLVNAVESALAADSWT